MQGVDYELLLRQRDWLIALCDEIERAGGDCEMADGLINLCDYLLDREDARRERRRQWDATYSEGPLVTS